MTDLVQQVLADMARYGIVPSRPEVIQFDTSEIIRFHIAGDKRGTLNGFCRLFSDGLPAGVFGSWKRGVQHVWCAKRQEEITPAEMEALQITLANLKKQREIEQSQMHEKVASVAQERFMALPAALQDHGYLLRKKIPPFTARQDKALLVLPIQDFSGKIWSLQTIAPNGRKSMLKGGRKKGFHIPIRDDETGRLLICEGFSTGAALALMFPDDGVIAAVDAGNLTPVAEAARRQYPDRQIIIAGDNDPTGRRYANKAAWQVKGLMMIPKIPGADWNDIWVQS